VSWLLPVERIISDEDWIKYKALSNLPDEARPLVDKIIDTHRRHKGNLSTGRVDIRKDINGIKDSIIDISARVEMIRQSDDFVNAIADTCFGRPREKRTRVLETTEKQVHALIVLAKEFAVMANRVPEAKRGKRINITDFTVDCLNSVLINYTGKSVVRSKKRNNLDAIAFVAEVLRLADPELENTMAKVLKLANSKRVRKASADTFARIVGPRQV
jgi:hypothetical protein